MGYWAECLSLACGAAAARAFALNSGYIVHLWNQLDRCFSLIGAMNTVDEADVQAVTECGWSVHYAPGPHLNLNTVGDAGGSAS